MTLTFDIEGYDQINFYSLLSLRVLISNKHQQVTKLKYRTQIPKIETSK